MLYEPAKGSIIGGWTFVATVPPVLTPIQIVLINAAIYLRHRVIVSLALNFQLGNTGTPGLV
jgi:hypothetical protein